MSELAQSFIELGTSVKVAAQHQMLRMGDVATRLYLIEEGCARLYLIDSQGRETSTQFFFEGEMVSSMESFLTGRPSALYLETVEACAFRVLEGSKLKSRAKENATLQMELQQLMQQRLVHYANLYASAIADTPTQRYVALKYTHQARLDRIPLNLLAAYLGVSPVHLSRIRRKLKECGQ